MELWQFNACIDGYADRKVDSSVADVHAGYWSAYYNNAKHAKPPTKIAGTIYEAHEKFGKSKRARPDVDVEAFLEREARFKARLREHQKKQ